MRSTIIGSALLLSLSACAGGPVTISHQHIAKPGVPGHANYAASQGPTPVVVRNNPMPAATVVAALQRNSVRPNLIFTTEPPASLNSGYRILLAFNEPPQGGPIVCSSNFAGETRPAAQSIGRVYGAFCLGSTLLSEATATSAQLSGSADPLLGRVMGDLLVALMPANEPYRDDRSWPGIKVE